jgi:hypothetical protein
LTLFPRDPQNPRTVSEVAGKRATDAVRQLRAFGAPGVVEGDRYPLPVSAAIALSLGAVMGAAAAVGVALSWAEPYWVPEPVLVLVIYVLMGRRERIQDKALGTSVGGAAAVVVALIARPRGL